MTAGASDRTGILDLFQGVRKVKARAIFTGQKILLRDWDGPALLGDYPAVVPVEKEGYAVLFRYGVVVFFNVPPKAGEGFLATLRTRIEDPFEKPETEEIEISIEEGREERIAQSTVVLAKPDVVRVQAVAEVLSRSVVLAHYEESLSEVFERVEPFAAELRRKGKSAWKGRELMRQIGDILMVQHRMSGRVEIEDKPDFLWESPELDRLYERLLEEFEIHERRRALERKLELLSRSAETLLTLQYDRRTLRVEWYIVILIMVEIVIILAEMMLRS